MPVISVIMPVYNAENFLSLAIESILQQSFQDFEFLIFNDGSIDNSVEIIKSYNDPRIRFFNNQLNCGIVKNLNKGIEISNGKYIARMDADDIAFPQRFQKQMDYLENNPEVGVCGTWLKVIDQDIVFKYPIDHKDILVEMISQNPMGHPSIMFRKSIIDSTGIYYKESYIPGEDYKMWVDLSAVTKLYNLPEVLINYRHHSNQSSRYKSELQRIILEKIKFEIIQDLVNLNENELVIYNNLINQVEDQLIDPSIIFKVLRKIILANRRKKIYDSKLFDDKFSGIWKNYTQHSHADKILLILLWVKDYPFKFSKLFYKNIVFLLLAVINSVLKTTIKSFIQVFIGLYLLIEKKFQKYKYKLKSLYLTQKWGKQLSLGENFKFDNFSAIQFFQPGKGKITVGNNVSFRKYCSVIIEEGTLNLADNVFFNNYCSITCLGEIYIGAHSLFGEGVRIYDHNHKYSKRNTPVNDQGMAIGKVTIGKYCWIGSNTIILNNVSIGDNVVIGANNLIYKDIPSNTLVKSKRETLLEDIV